MVATLTQEQSDWLELFTGLSLSAGTPANQPGASPAPGGPPPVAVPTASAPAAAPEAAAPKTPEDERAELERRLKVSGPLYAKYGPAADNMVDEKDRLTPAEQKIGGVYVERTRDTSLNGRDAATTVDEKGVTMKSSSSVTANTIGADGKVDEFSRERTSALNVGLGNATKTDTATTTTASGGVKTVDSSATSTTVDLTTGTASQTRTTSNTVTDTNTKTTTADKTSTTFGTAGLSRTHDKSTQVGQQLDSTSSTVGLTRSEGQIGVGGSYGAKSGTMTGPADRQTMEKGAEVAGRGGAAVVSDDKGIGLGANAGADSKIALGSGFGLKSAIGGGGKCQSTVAEIPSSDPPKFSITTTISFDVSASAGGGYDKSPQADDMNKGDTKASVSIGASAALSKSASFTRVLEADEAKTYLDSIRDNGRGGKLPEHKILVTGMAQGWPAAQLLWASMNGGPDQARSLKAGESVSKSTQTSAGQQVGVSGGEDREGGLSLGGSYSQTQSHAVAVKKSGLPDGRIQVTATIADTSGSAETASVGMGVASGRGGVSHGEGKARTVVFTLDPKSPDFDSLVKQIDAATTAAEIDRIAAANKKAVASTTDTDQQSDGTSVGMSVAGVSIDLAGKGTITNEVTKDADGNVTQTKSTGTNQTGGTFGIGGAKVGGTETQSYTGVVKDGKATGEIADQHTSTSVGKTLQNLANAGKDPHGSIMHPSKLVADEVNTEGTAVADPEIMAICSDALNERKWNSKVGGMRMDDWIATGKKIRAAIVVKDGQIVSVNKSAVQKAMAEWTKSDDGKRTEVLDSLVRPLGGMPTGKAFAFPDGTEGFKPQWDALIIADPLEPLRAMIKDKPQDALKAMKDLRGQLQSLQNGIKSASAKWAGYEIQQAEMLGHINDRIGEVDKRIHDMAPPPAKPATPKPDIGPPSPDQAQAEVDAAKQHADDVKADLEHYNNNIAQMQTYANAVFGILGKAEARMKDDGFFSDNAITRLLDAGKMVKQAEDQIKIWDALYGPTYQLYEKLSQSVTGLDKSRLEKLHVAGAQGRCKQVYDMTRDTSMTGRM